MYMLYILSRESGSYDLRVLRTRGTHTVPYTMNGASLASLFWRGWLARLCMENPISLGSEREADEHSSSDWQ